MRAESEKFLDMFAADVLTFREIREISRKSGTDHEVRRQLLRVPRLCLLNCLRNPFAVTVSTVKDLITSAPDSPEILCRRSG